MANVLKHRFASGKADGPDATQVQPSNWNDGHLFSGGNAGDLLTRDPTDASYGAAWQARNPPGGNLGDLLSRDASVATYGAKWIAPPAAPGVWATVPFNAANFAGVAPLVWTIGSAAIVRNRYAIVGKILFWSLYVSWYSGSNVLSGTPGTALRVTAPGGLTLALSQQLLIDYCQGAAGVPIAGGFMITTNGPSAIDITKVAGGNFALSDIPGFNVMFTLELT